MRKISFYNPPVTNIKPNQTITFGELIELIKGEKYKGITEKLRSLPENEQSVFKKQNLPCVTVSGEFSVRNDKSILQYSDALVADVDNLNPFFKKKALFFLNLLDDDTPIVMAFISPSGNGIKIIVKVDSNRYTHKQNFEAVIIYLSETLKIDIKNFDKSGCNISRACFLCHDNKMWVHKNFVKPDFDINALDASKYLTTDDEKSDSKEDEHLFDSERVEINTKVVDVSNDALIYLEEGTLDFDHKNQHSNFSKLLVMTLNKTGKYKKGNRHNFLQKLVSNGNHFGMSEDAMSKYCVDYFFNHPETKIDEVPFSIEKELLPLIKDTYNRYKDQFGTWKENIIEEYETPPIPLSVYESLPFYLRNMCLKFDHNRERDVFFLGLLGVLSTCFPRVQGIYDQKILGMNLFIFISAPASAGKGNLYWSRKLANPMIKSIKENYQAQLQEFEEATKLYESAAGEEKRSKPIKPLKTKFIIPGNSSTSAIISCMHGNEYYGLIFETEADTLANTLKKSGEIFQILFVKPFTTNQFNYYVKPMMRTLR